MNRLPTPQFQISRRNVEFQANQAAYFFINTCPFLSTLAPCASDLNNLDKSNNKTLRGMLSLLIATFASQTPHTIDFLTGDYHCGHPRLLAAHLIQIIRDLFTSPEVFRNAASCSESSAFNLCTDCSHFSTSSLL